MNQTTSENSIIDVLVVGAGPVGLLFANELQQYGCNFRIVDRNETESVHSKAILIMPRTMEALDDRDLLDPFLHRGHIASAISFRGANKPLFSFSSGSQAVNTPFPYPLILPQTSTEQLLEETLRKSSHNDSIVERGVVLVGYEEDENQEVVVARLQRQTPEGELREEVVRARYIVGCDGVHSGVRKGKADWTFQGHSYKSAWAIADLNLRSESIKSDQVILFMHPEGVVAVIPFGGPDRYRIIFNLGDFGYDNSSKVTHGVQDARHQLVAPTQPEFTMEQLRAIVDQRVAPEKFEITAVTWSNTFRINERMVNGYRRGRAFVVGDAAHCHSPAGGQGMNMGMQDAHNLSWKLALVLQGKAKDIELVLDSYSTERAPIASQVLQFTGQLTKFTSKRSRILDYIRLYVVPRLFSPEFLQTIMLGRMFGFNVSYTTSSPLNHPTPHILRQSRRRNGWFGFLLSFFFGAPRELIEPGTHLPDAVLKLPNRQAGRNTLTLYDVLRGSTTHTLILLSNEGGITRGANPMVARVMGIAQRYRSTVRVVVVGYVHNIDQSDLDDPREFVADGTFAELKPELHQHLGVPEGGQAVVVVRPDRYVAFSALKEEVESGELEKFLEGYLVEDI